MSASQIICKEQKERGRETIRNLLIYGMIYLGSALMICNIRQYVRFARHIRERGEWEQEQRILHQRFTLGLRYSEIAAAEGISRVAVWKHLSHALNEIKKQFNPKML